MPKRRRFDADRFEQRVKVRRGVLHVRELVRLGLPRSTIYHRARPHGPWQLPLRGVVVTFSGPLLLGHRLTAAIRYAGGGAMVTGIASLRLRGLTNLPSDGLVHVLITHRKRRASTGYVVIERTRRMPKHNSLYGIRCAPIARAVIDATRAMTQLEAVRALIAEVVQRRMCTVADLAEEIRAAQRRGTALPRRVLREVAAGVRSVAEAEAREIILNAGLPEPLWNHDVYDKNGRWLARPDAIWVALGLVLEIDSLEWHLSPASYRRTQARQRRMAKQGLRVFPAAPGWIRSNPDEFLNELRSALHEAPTAAAPEITVRAPQTAA